LIFRSIKGAKKLETAGCVVATNACVVAGGEAIGADLTGHAEQRLELYVGIAIGAGDGCAAAQIVFHEGTNDAFFELRFEIDDVMREIQVLRDALGVVYIVERAAAVLCGTLIREGALKFGQTALVPQLHGQADDWAVLLLEHGRDGRRIHAAGHGDGNQAGRSVCADRQ